MITQEDLLQERLEQLEAGKSIEESLIGLPEVEAELLQLAAMLREIPFAEQDSESVTVQRAQLLRLAMKENSMTEQAPRNIGKGWTGFLPEWLFPRTKLVGGIAFLLIFALVVTVGWRIFSRPSENTQVAQEPPSSTVDTNITSPTVETEPEPTASAVAQAPIVEPDNGPAYGAYIPVITMPAVPNAQSAAVENLQGLVQVQNGDGSWTAVHNTQVISAGQRVRTGKLSSATLTFYDGSQTHLEANTEISVDELDARPTDGPRIVVLTQWLGKSRHDVTPLENPDSRYEVRTPTSAGVAKGTSFHVLVTPSLLTTFSVDEGSVAVTGLDVTVLVIAGQLTVINPGTPPIEPVFRISGEGEVTQIGPLWTIGGQTFTTSDATIIIGNPQVGDIVAVEGHLLADGTRIADRIMLLSRSPINSFAVSGPVDSIDTATWRVANQNIVLNEETVIDDEIVVGDLVRVEGIVLPGGTLLAERILLIESAAGLPFRFVGVVETIEADTWIISGVPVVIDVNTVLAPGIEAGELVIVQGRIQAENRWLAASIELFDDDDYTFTFTGIVQNIDPWNVAGIAFETRAWTTIEPGITVGNRVRVTGHILEDGTWVASAIELIDNDNEIQIVFIGIVASIDPWVVSGIPLLVNGQTIIDDTIVPGILVRVDATIQSDGQWMATRIQRVGNNIGSGCFTISATVVSINNNQLVLHNWPAITLDGSIPVVGNIGVDNVVLLYLCFHVDGTITIINIVVIYQPIVIITPSPVPPPPPPPPDNGDSGDRVTICHKPGRNAQTLTLPRPALSGHLNHGDTIGPCGG